MIFLYQMQAIPTALVYLRPGFIPPPPDIGILGEGGEQIQGEGGEDLIGE